MALKLMQIELDLTKDKAEDDRKIDVDESIMSQVRIINGITFIHYHRSRGTNRQDRGCN